MYVLVFSGKVDVGDLRKIMEWYTVVSETKYTYIDMHIGHDKKRITDYRLWSQPMRLGSLQACIRTNIYTYLETYVLQCSAEFWKR